MEPAALPLHFTDLQSEPPHLELQQQAAAAPGRVEQVIPQWGARCRLTAPARQADTEPPAPPVKRITTAMGYTAGGWKQFVIYWWPSLQGTLFYA